MANDINAIIRTVLQRQNKLDNDLREILKACLSTPPSITEEIDALPGRRIFYNLSDEGNFVATDAGTRMAPLNFLVSQDGPFVMTHYPCVAWKPNLPTTATNFGRWSPIYSSPMPTQDAANNDAIDISYEVIDSGSQRLFQNEPALPLLSRFDAALPLPVPTLFSPNTVIQFFTTLEDIAFNATPGIPTEGGVLRVTLPGYRIINL
ncbi:MAG: hypothetical protein Q8S00_32655 [Deltaproteobacteria bacterium]|nr:hypothetical protein [Deltaproteobacteria bacterium]